jgi:hypothetical protein
MMNWPKTFLLCPLVLAALVLPEMPHPAAVLS